MNAKIFYIVKARIRLKPTNEGGRKTGIKSGYRPNHVFEYKNGNMVSAYMGDVIFDEQEWIEPGEEKVVTIRFMSGQAIKDFLTVGRIWWIHEGNRLVAEAEIVGI